MRARLACPYTLPLSTKTLDNRRELKIFNMAWGLKMKTIFTLWLLHEEVHSATRYRRLSLAEPSSDYYYNQVKGYPGAYTFGYDVSDPGTGNIQYRKEERFPNGTIMGSYGYLDPFGSTRRYQYIADEKGYRVYNVPKVDGFESESIQAINGQKASTESSVTWTRPTKAKKKKVQQAKPIDLNNNFYFNPRPPSYYAID